MSIKIEAASLLSVLGENGERWLQRSWGDYAAPADEKPKLCLHGAIRRCSPQPGDSLIVERVADSQGWGPYWNDKDGRRWSEIRDLINGGIEVTDEDLAETFGPQWEPIVALVRRAAIMTTEEAKVLTAAVDAA